MIHNNRRVFLLAGAGLCVAVLLGLVYAMKAGATSPDAQSRNQTTMPRRDFDVQVVVDGRTLEEYAARGRTYVEALEGREYQLRVHNPYPYRVAVALSVDGLNSIDARHTSAWEASKWVIEAYGSIDVSGWQVSSSRARQFYFTSEQDSYGAKLGQTSNLGVIAAVFYRERQPNPIRITPPTPRPVYPPYEKDGRREDKSSERSAGSASNEPRAKPMPAPDDESAATGIGRSVGNDVRWVNMDLDSRAMSEVVIRYEFYQGLVRLGILPRSYQRPDTMGRREAARGFEDRRFSPEP